MGIRFLLLRIYARILRMITPNSGLTRLSFNPITNYLFRDQPSEQITRTTDGIKIRTRIDDYHGRILWLFGSNDFKVARVAQHFAKPCDVFLDIGANYSTIGMSVAKHANAHCKVHLFEPQPYLVAYVEEAIKNASLSDRIKMHSVALLDKAGSFDMAVPGHHSGLATLVMEERFREGVKTIKVPTVVTNSYVQSLVRSAPFGVKIDIEGAEKLVLPGLLQQDDMRFCLFEGANTDPEIIALFEASGFMVFGLCRTILSVRLFPVDSVKTYKNFHDFVAINTAHRDWPEKPMSLQDVSLTAWG